MAIYVGGLSGTTGFVRLPMCFTGLDAMLMRNLIAHAEILGNGAMGGAVGLIMSLIAGPEGAPQIAGTIVGAIVGAICGGVLTLIVLLKGACTCPPGADGF